MAQTRHTPGIHRVPIRHTWRTHKTHMWRDAGKSRNDATQSDMRVSRLQFKYALRCCRANEDMHRADALAQSLKGKNSTSFWKDVQKIASSKIPLSTKVGDAVGDEEVSEM